MEPLKAIEILQSQNQRLVDKYGVSDLTRLNDQVIKSFINLYMSSKNYEQDFLNMNGQISTLIDQIAKYKLFLKLFGLPVKRIAEIHPDILKIVDRENIATKYSETAGFFCLEFLFIEIENIQLEIRNFMFPISAYYETQNQELKNVYPEHGEYFEAIDSAPENDLQAFNNIYFDAYKYCISRLTYINK
jgi:hypothetical protein